MKTTLLGRAAARLHAILDVALAFLLVALLVLAAAKTRASHSFGERAQQLSERAVEMLEGLDGSVKCVVVLPGNNGFHERLRQLLLNMKDAAKGVEFEFEFLDPHADVARAADVVRAFGADGPCVIFEQGDRHEIVPFESLIERTNVEEDSLLPGSVVHTRFRGEQQCVTALARLARPKSPVLYALAGHGERDFANYDKLGGYSDLAREIRREGYELRELKLADDGQIPGDCDLLVIAGPRRPPYPSEAESICSFFSKGGRILLLADRLDVPGGWNDVAERLGVSFPGLTVISGGTMGGYNVTIDFFSSHPIARDLEKNAVTFSSPQVIDAVQEALQKYRLSHDVVVRAGTKAWGETSPDILPRIYDPGIDRRGLLPIAIATEVSGGEDLGLKFSRAFTIGDSSIGANAFLGGGNTANRDLILNAIGWLTESGMPSSPSASAEGDALRLNLSRKSQIRFWTNSVVIWPLSVCLLGAAIALARRIAS